MAYFYATCTVRVRSDRRGILTAFKFYIVSYMLLL